MSQSLCDRRPHECDTVRLIKKADQQTSCTRHGALSADVHAGNEVLMLLPDIFYEHHMRLV